MKLTDKVAIVTGGNRGIGRAIALAFAREGAKVAIVGRDKSRCDEVAAEVAKSGGTAIGIQADVSKESDVARMVQQTKDKFQRIDILVNNAGVNLPYRTVAELTLEEWNRVLGVNLTGTFLCSRAVLPHMIAQHQGKIINMASYGGRHGAEGRSPYRSSKAAIIVFTECLAAEVKQHGIDVNAICPALVATDMLAEIMGSQAPPDIPQPEEIADLALFLVSDAGRSISGSAVDAFGDSNPLYGSKTWTYRTE